ncbi:MAG: tetratricopeptide repeat protein [Methylacidiphilales bacterium]|nr:tetratricopeptide repeat protein [Candidatus Methylacidiphilales bacterium]
MKPKQACLLLAASLLPLSPLSLFAADGTATSSQPTTAAQAAHAEAVNRQQLNMSANQAISDGQRLLGSGNYDEAADRFQYAVDALTPGGVSATSYNRAEAGLAAAKAGQAQELAKDDKFAQAATLLQQASVLQPNNPVYPADIEELKKQQLAYEAQVRDPEGTVNNPAVTDEFKSRVATVQKLLFQGDAYFRTGQYDKAEETYSKALILDPYNKAARNKMDHVNKYKLQAAVVRHEEYEQSAMEKVDHDWVEAISPDIVAGPATQGPIVSSSNRVNITHKLESIIIDKVNFEKLDIAAVIQFLQDKSKELDPDHQGINFVLRLNSETAAPEAAPAPGGAAAPTGAAPAAGEAAPAASQAIHREVSISLTDVPLSEILGYIIQQTNLQYSVEDYAVYLRPSIDEGETLSVRTFLVPPGFFEGSALHVTEAAPSDTSGSTVESVSANAQRSLTDKGIRFPAGSSAIFLPGSSKLVVRDTPEQLDLVANLIDQLSKEPPQIQLEAKIAEFNQDAIKSLTFNYFGGTNGGSLTIDNKVGFQTALRTADYPTPTGLGGLVPNEIDQLIQQNPATPSGVNPSVNPLSGGGVANNTPNTLSVGLIIDNTGLAAIMTAINNLQGVSLLSAPSVTTQNNLKADIEIVQEFPYPTSFAKPQLSSNSQLEYTSGPGAGAPLVLALPPTPSEFVTQDVGVSLEVKPTTYPDQRIDLDITKCQVLDFDGFIDYGVPILERSNAVEPISTQQGVTLTPGTINQPVFSVRSVVTNLQVLDGQTAVLGGLVTENTQEINDKVPVLGDIPLIGRAFQSKVSERTKKDLLFFITARLIRSNGKLQYVKTLNAEPEEEALPEPEEQIGPGVTLPPLPEGEPNS